MYLIFPVEVPSLHGSSLYNSRFGAPPFLILVTILETLAVRALDARGAVYTRSRASIERYTCRFQRFYSVSPAHHALKPTANGKNVWQVRPKDGSYSTDTPRLAENGLHNWNDV